MTFFNESYLAVLPELHSPFKNGRVKEDHKPSSVIPIPLLRGNREDGHLSRTLIAQGLKRPNPPCFHSTNRADLNGLFLSRLWNGRRRPSVGRETGPIWSCSGWGLPGYPDRSGYGGLLPRLFTLTLWNSIAAIPQDGIFLWHFPYPRERRRAFSQGQSALRTTLPCGARTFLPS